jgi:NIMA-interacting peptidyl-prolyl cis-trans isomerase 1
MTDFQPPPWVKPPQLNNCGLRVVKDKKTIQVIKTIAQKPFILFGRNANMCDHKLEHPSISRRHAMIAHGSSGNVYVMDLGSSHGTFHNSKRLPKLRREPLADNDIIKFGASTREYIIKLDLDIEDISKFKQHTKYSNMQPQQQQQQQQQPQELKVDESKNNGNQAENGNQSQSNGNAAQSRKRQRNNNNNINNESIVNSTETEPSLKRHKLNDTVNNAVDQITCCHLLVKHKASRRPKSWKSPDGISRTKSDAMDILNGLRADIVMLDDPQARIDKFQSLARQESDCNSAKRGGDLGAFGRNKMQKPFEDAAFNLEIGEISEVVDTDSGVHIILRIK